LAIFGRCCVFAIIIRQNVEFDQKIVVHVLPPSIDFVGILLYNMSMIAHFWRYILSIAVLMALLTCTSCSSQPIAFSKYAMGTLVSVTLFDYPETDKANQAVDAAFDELRRIELMTARDNMDSELYGVNLAAYDEDTAVSEELFALLQTAVDYCERSGGALDITLGKLSLLWDVGGENQRVPSDGEIAGILQNTGYQYLSLNEANHTVRFLKSDVMLDLGAVAKGYASDRMRSILTDYGVTSGMIDLGGNIMMVGSARDIPWRVGIRNPRPQNDDDALYAVADIKAGAVVTSGDYERYFISDSDGARYHHIIDPATGYPAQSGLFGASIMCDSGLEADCLSTAFFVMGADKAAALAQDLGVDYFFVLNDMRYMHSDGLTVEVTAQAVKDLAESIKAAVG
jgi:thiamine biosynthesis lipoprotein